LFARGQYGKGEELFQRLPPYIQRAMVHLTGKGAAA